MLRPTALRLIAFLLLTLVVPGLASAAAPDGSKAAIRAMVNQAMSFAEMMPREKVSVHLDNTGYFKGDKIWFQCYVIDGLTNAPTPLSHTLYVELLNPRGNVIAHQTLRIENGRCHGAFTLNHVPFYSGFYEIRAYTKYMLNFGEAAVFSRVIPVFDAPAKPGDFSKRKMIRYTSKYPGARPETKAGGGVSMRFFPEGGRLIDGVPAKVAFEVTGKSGVPIDAVGRVVDESTGMTVAGIRTLHEGRGVFEFTPAISGRYKAIITRVNEDHEHKFNLPAVAEDGIGLSVDNLSHPDSIFVTIHPGNGTSTPGIAGMAVSLRGVLWSFTFIDPAKPRTVRMSSRDMPSGVSVISLFGPDGHTMAERMIFVNNGGYGRVAATIEIPEQNPSGPVALDITATDADNNPAAMLPLSVSVTDGDHAVDYQGGVLADLLLMSEIKGYVRDPMQYFRNDSDTDRRNLDLLMMVTGWRSYSWEEMAGVNPLTHRYDPEEAIDMEGKVVSFVRSIPKPNVDLSVILSEKNAADSLRHNFTSLLTTDSCGRFYMSYDFNGKWDLVMSVREKGKKKDHRIILDRLFSPEPRRYEPAEMTVSDYTVAADLPSADIDSIAEENTDLTPDETADTKASKSIKLKEVVVKGKNRHEADIYKARAKSVVYYDVAEELGDLADKSEIVGQDLFAMLKSINRNFSIRIIETQPKLYYRTKPALLVIDYKTTYEEDSLNYTLLYLESIKSIYVTEDPVTMLTYADPRTNSLFDIDSRYGCAVLIETNEKRRGPAGKGTRLQTIEGYTIPEEFQNIDNPALIDDPDFRRTLYWNPQLITGPDGKARVQFLNNSTCPNLRVSIQGIDSIGTVYSH